MGFKWKFATSRVPISKHKTWQTEISPNFLIAVGQDKYTLVVGYKAGRLYWIQTFQYFKVTIFKQICSLSNSRRSQSTINRRCKIIVNHTEWTKILLHSFHIKIDVMHEPYLWNIKLYYAFKGVRLMFHFIRELFALSEIVI